MSQKQILSIPLVRLEAFNNVTPSLYVSAYREGGIRLQQQTINDKHIYHNYGQGHSQFSLAYGCAYIASKMITLKKQSSKAKDVAIIGNNINSLMTALQLAKRGNLVTLYSSRLPVEIKKGEGKKIAGGQGFQFWYPSDYNNCDPLKHELISKVSIQYLKQCLISNRYQSLKPISLYIRGPIRQQIQQNITQFISKQVGNTSLLFDNGKLQQNSYTYFNTILINTELLIEQLYVELKLRNVSFVVKQFLTIKDVLSLKEQYIYNCDGILSKKVFGDQAVKEIQNFNILVSLSHDMNHLNKTSSIQKKDFIIWESSQKQKQNKQSFIIYFTKNKIQISTKYKLENNLSAKLTQQKDRILMKAYNYMKQRSVKPYKL